jgi:hypothetical protein
MKSQQHVRPNLFSKIPYLGIGCALYVLHASVDLGSAREFLDGWLEASGIGVDGLAMRRIVAHFGNRAPFMRFIASQFADWIVLVHTED